MCVRAENNVLCESDCDICASSQDSVKYFYVVDRIVLPMCLAGDHYYRSWCSLIRFCIGANSLQDENRTTPYDGLDGGSVATPLTIFGGG